MFKVIIFLTGLFVVRTCIEASIELKSYSYSSKNFVIKVNNIDQKAVFYLEKFGRIVQVVQLDDDFGKNFSVNELDDGFILNGYHQQIEFKVVDNTMDFSLVKISRTLNSRQRVTDCLKLETGHMHWYGGPSIQATQFWPVEKLQIREFAFVPTGVDAAAVTERYWLQSRGAFLFVDGKVPLFINQNVKGNTLCLIAENKLPYNVRRSEFNLVYHIGVGFDAKQAHLQAIKRFIKTAKSIPDRRMVEYPIWSTWARYKTNVSDEIISEFANEILSHEFPNSQLEIDDDWEKCYGSLTFNESKFAGIKQMARYLKSKGFRITLWVHPFINKNCEPWYSEAKESGFFVVNHENDTDTQWWNSKYSDAALIDFTNPKANNWFKNRLESLKDYAGLDGFKFDAGEASFTPVDPKLNVSIEDHPNVLTEAYVRLASHFGPVVEVCSGQNSQDLPIFLRMLDKDSEWSWNNGLPTLITTLLQLNMVGYGFILPDMIGGNGYNGKKPSKELFIRWLQANVFMPSLQFSYVPWDYDDECVAISKNFTQLHAQYTDVILNAMENAVNTGSPVNAPIWWIDPLDQVALSISDEFLLGERILSAPVIDMGATQRNVYLPKGEWFDPHKKKTYRGPIWLMKYPAPLNVLPYFILES